MDIREATDADAPAIEALVDGAVDGDHLVRERTVIVAETGEDLAGFAAYDTWNGTVHVSALVGDPAIVEALLAEPTRFAEREGLPLEIVVPETDEAMAAAVADVGFEEVGRGPRFDGERTLRYRLVP